MLQVLCQILQTDNLQDVQTWLVSTSETGKKLNTYIIDSKLKIEKK